MIDTNQIVQATQVVQSGLTSAATIKEQLSPYMPALAVGAAWAGRELNRACASARGGAEWLMSHGGLIGLGIKLFWNDKNANQQKDTKDANDHS